MIEVAPQLATLYTPQMQQFHIDLQPRGAVLAGSVNTGECHGSAWAMPVSSNCLIIDHSITPAEDVVLYESPSRPYACVCSSSTAAVESMPDFNIPAAQRIGGSTTRGADACLSFKWQSQGGVHAVLTGGKTYRSRSICMFPDMFSELEAMYPDEPLDLFETFDEPWNEEASQTIRSTLNRLEYRRLTSAGAQLFARASIESLVAELALARSCSKRAMRERGTCEAERLVAGVRALVSRALDEKRAPSVNELASKLYVSRSQLCATFKQESGESVGAYVRRTRMERACELLCGGASVAEVATAAGYENASAFSTAFKRETGISPTAWQTAAR